MEVESEIYIYILHPPAELDPFLLVFGLDILLPHLVVGLDVLGFENVHHRRPGNVEHLCHRPLAGSFFVEELSGNLVGQLLVTNNSCRSPRTRTAHQAGTSLDELLLHPLNESEKSVLSNSVEVLISTLSREKEIPDLLKACIGELGHEDIHLLGNQVAGSFLHLVSCKSIRPGKCKH